MVTHPTAPHKLGEPLPPTLSVAPSFSKEPAQLGPKAEVLLACTAVTGSGRRFWARTPSGEGWGSPGWQPVGTGSRLRAAAARRLELRFPACSAAAARPGAAPGREQPVDCLARPGHGAALLAGPSTSGQTDWLPAPPAPGWARWLVSAPRGGWGPARARRRPQPPARSVWRPRPPCPREDAPRRLRSAGRALEAGAASGLLGSTGGSGRRGGEAPGGCGSHALQCGSAVSAAPGPPQWGRGLCPPWAAGPGFSTLGFVPHFILSC